MVTEEDVLAAVSDCNEDRKKTFAEFIAHIFTGQFVELYLGDSYEEISVEQVSQSYPAVFVGKVVAAYKECLVISCPYVQAGTRTPQMGNLVFVSERAIRGLNAVDGKGTIEDMFLRSKESLEIKETFKEMLKDKLTRE